jgi:hypothetical protein
LLELASIAFISAAFGKGRELRQYNTFHPELMETVVESEPLGTSVRKAFSKADALKDFTAMRSSGSQNSSLIDGSFGKRSEQVAD